MHNIKYQNSVILLIIGIALSVFGRLFLIAGYGFHFNQIIWLIFNIAFNVLFFLYLYKYENTNKKNLFFQIAFFAEAAVCLFDFVMSHTGGILTIFMLITVACNCLVAVFGIKRDKNIRIAYFALIAIMVIEVFSNLRFFTYFLSLILWAGPMLGKIAALLYLHPHANRYVMNTFSSNPASSQDVNSVNYEQLLISLKYQFDNGLIGPEEYEARRAELIKKL